MDERRANDDPAARPGAADVSLRDRFAALSKEKPRPPRLRNFVWFAAGGAVLAVTLAQVLGLARHPVDASIREGVAHREADRAKYRAEEEAAKSRAERVGFDETVPFPAGLPTDAEASLRVAFGVAAHPDVEVAGRAVAGLPALAAKVPEERRREVRTFLLRRLEPLLRAGEHAPLAAEARAAAAEILTADPDSDPGAAPPR